MASATYIGALEIDAVVVLLQMLLYRTRLLVLAYLVLSDSTKQAGQSSETGLCSTFRYPNFAFYTHYVGILTLHSLPTSSFAQVIKNVVKVSASSALAPLRQNCIDRSQAERNHMLPALLPNTLQKASSTLKSGYNEYRSSSLME